MLITIDGVAGAGKSTVSKRVGDSLCLAVLNTGSMYRAITFALLQAGINLHQHETVEDAVHRLLREERLIIRLQGAELAISLHGRRLTDAELRTEDISRQTPFVSSCLEVRRLVRGIQHRLTQHGGVIEGRDTASVFPHARLKVFLQASEHVRAKRRLDELGIEPTVERIEKMLTDLTARDFHDRHRIDGALKIHPDSFIIDTDTLEIDEVVAKIVAEARERALY